MSQTQGALCFSLVLILQDYNDQKQSRRVIEPNSSISYSWYSGILIQVYNLNTKKKRRNMILPKQNNMKNIRAVLMHEALANMRFDRDNVHNLALIRDCFMIQILIIWSQRGNLATTTRLVLMQIDYISQFSNSVFKASFPLLMNAYFSWSCPSKNHNAVAAPRKALKSLRNRRTQTRDSQ